LRLVKRRIGGNRLNDRPNCFGCVWLALSMVDDALAKDWVNA
jgi:hypothetical protein